MLTFQFFFAIRCKFSDDLRAIKYESSKVLSSHRAQIELKVASCANESRIMRNMCYRKLLPRAITPRADQNLYCREL